MFEQRTMALPAGSELRAINEERRTIAGLAVPFNSRSSEMLGFIETIRRGAFSLDADIRALFSHDARSVLGRTKNRMLRLTEGEAGIDFELDLPDTAVGRDVFALVKRGDIDAMSFGFRTISDRWYVDAGVNHREIIAGELVEISPVAFPAYEATRVGA